MQFKVPQDVQREDTIIGPITLKQMGILGIGGGLAYSIYVTLSKTYFIEIWLPPVAIISLITLAFAFLKIHQLPFHEYLMNMIEYNVLPKKRMWIQGGGYPFIPPASEEKKQEDKKIKQAQVAEKEKSIEELSAVLDRNSKKEGLNKIINQNYK